MLKLLKSQLFPIILLLTSIVLFLIFLFVTSWNDTKSSNYIELNALFLIVFTAILVWVAFTQLSSLNKTAKMDFLMRLDQRYGSIEIIKARQIIHRFYRSSKDATPNAPEIVHWNNIGNEIDSLSRASDIKSQKEYVYILNLLDFLETLAYYANRGHIEPNELDDLMGISIKFFHTILKPRIDDRKGKYGEKDFYKEFEILASKKTKPS